MDILDLPGWAVRCVDEDEGHLIITAEVDVEAVVMDLWNPYRLAVRQMLPRAVIVADKFHVLRFILAQDLGYVLLHSPVAGKTGVCIE